MEKIVKVNLLDFMNNKKYIEKKKIKVMTEYIDIDKVQNNNWTDSELALFPVKRVECWMADIYLAGFQYG